MAQVYGIDAAEQFTLLHSAASRREAIRWAGRYIRWGDFGGYAEIVVKDGDCWVWERSALDDAEYRAEMFERDAGA